MAALQALPAQAQPQNAGEAPPGLGPPVWLVADRDDDDHNGLPDGLQEAGIPLQDLWPIPPRLLTSGGSLRTTSDHIRLVRGGKPLEHSTQLDGPAAVFVQGLRPGPGQVEMRDATGQPLRRLLFHVVGLRFLDAQNRPIDPSRQQARFSLRVTNDASLPRGRSHRLVSADPNNLRAELLAPTWSRNRTQLRIAGGGHDAHAQPQAAELVLQARRPASYASSQGLRSRFVRLVADHTDLAAPGVSRQVLLTELGAALKLTWRSPDGRTLRQQLRVGLGRAGPPPLPTAYRAQLRVHVLRTEAGGPPVIGDTPEDAVAIMRAQIHTANQIWAQCGIHFGSAATHPVAVIPPPAPALLSLADGHGLPAKGQGRIQLRVDGQEIGPIRTEAWRTPLDTALLVSKQLQRAGFANEVTENPRTLFGVHASADLLVHGQYGGLAHLAPNQNKPLSSDVRQKLLIGRVDLADGLQEFDNLTARSGTLEERALLRPLSDNDPTTIELVVVNHFTDRSRQGEAFIAANGGPLVNTVVLDRHGLEQRESAWTLAHELGHVLLDDPLHPDRDGRDHPFRLMDADASRGTVYGPKRLSPAECQRALERSGPQAPLPLLTADDLTPPGSPPIPPPKPPPRQR